MGGSLGGSYLPFTNNKKTNRCTISIVQDGGKWWTKYWDIEKCSLSWKHLKHLQEEQLHIPHPRTSPSLREKQPQNQQHVQHMSVTGQQQKHVLWRRFRKTNRKSPFATLRHYNYVENKLLQKQQTKLLQNYNYLDYKTKLNLSSSHPQDTEHSASGSSWYNTSTKLQIDIVSLASLLTSWKQHS